MASWRDVFLGFRMKHGGVDPERLPPDAWMNLAAREESWGRPREAEVYMEAGLVSEAYGRNIYDPPHDLVEAYAKGR